MNTTTHTQQKPSDACIIWLHGLGADSSDMAGLAQALPLKSSIEHIFLDAPFREVTVNAGMRMRAWYDVAGFDFKTREDEKGIFESAKRLTQEIEKIRAAGYAPNDVFLAGFSQGGAIALYTALQYPHGLAGVISLSAYLPLAHNCHPQLPYETPIFIAYGQHDNLVLPSYSEYTSHWLYQKGYQKITRHAYPMMHEICEQEIHDLSLWIENNVKRA